MKSFTQRIAVGSKPEASNSRAACLPPSRASEPAAILTCAPGEMRSASIKGGTEKKVAAGDVVTIPVKVPHQMKLDTGKQITYFVVKVTQ